MNIVQKVGAVFILFALGAGTAMADRHWHDDSHFRVFISPYWTPYWGSVYYPPYYYRPYYYAYPQPPQTYIEQEAPASPASNYYWYYCPTSKAYYPYVKRCSVPWQKVVPTPPNQ